jgi:hypothetical protein
MKSATGLGRITRIVMMLLVGTVAFGVAPFVRPAAAATTTGAVAYIAISPGDYTFPVDLGGFETFVSGYDAAGNWLGFVTDDTVITTNSPVLNCYNFPDPPFSSFQCRIAYPRAGSYQVTATYTKDPAILPAHVVVTLTPTAPVGFVLSPTRATIALGQSISYRAFTVDAYGNYITNIMKGTTITLKSNGKGAAASCPAGLCTPTMYGTYTVVGSNAYWGTSLAQLQVAPPIRPVD